MSLKQSRCYQIGLEVFQYKYEFIYIKNVNKMIRKSNDKRKKGKDKAKENYKRNGKYTAKSIRKKEENHKKSD